MGKRLDASRIETRLIPIDLIDDHPENYNQHPATQIVQLSASHDDFGQYRSITVWARPNGRYTRVVGHGYSQGAKQAGETVLRCEVYPEDTPPETIKAIMLADNLHAKNSLPDDMLLAQLLQEQANAGFDLATLGTDAEALREMLASMGDAILTGDSAGDEAADDLPDAVETRCKPGDIWQLGRHRVACMDALDPATYSKLLQDTRPHAIITDPPYGMRLDADFSGMKNNLGLYKSKGLTHGKRYDNVIGDHEDFNATLLTSLFADVKEQFWFGADYYSATLPDTMHAGCWLVWDKRLDESADKMFGSCFELIWSRQKHKRDILRHKWAGVFGTEHEPQRGRVHPNQKPVRLFEDLLARYTSEGQIILDPFMGSGTLLISAERTVRIAYGCEISPAYCDVVIARYEAETGATATLLSRREEPAHE